ncbi:PQQ-binding-like beta-propeller repeat protein [Verrucomicrobiales bacterium BCK34]|nr:PQQ-binding-like beta-propeller repeat protein [Verrucomicrobiales bacterium BCK34]
MIKLFPCSAIFAIFLSPVLSQGDDWPQWLGPERDGIWREDGIVETFSENGPEVLWRVPVSHGYSSPTVSGGKVYLSDYLVEEGEIFNNPGARAPLEGKERIRCFDAGTGEEIWSYAYDQPYNLSYPGGPRSTPTVADGKVYALGAEGNFVCLDANSGELVWTLNWKEKFSIESPMWGFTSHPLVDGDTLYCIVGGEGSVAVAFDKNTGGIKWQSLSASEPGYSPPTMIEHAGAKQLLIWHTESINSLNPEDGSLYWSLPLKPGFGMSIMAPQKSGNLLFTSGHGRVGAVMKLDDEKPGAEMLWKAKPKQGVFAANVTPLIIDGVIYGSDIDTSAFIAASLETGERFWQTTVPTLGEENPERGGRHGTAFVTLHEESGRLYLLSETGHLIIAEVSSEAYTEISRAKVIEPTNEAFGRKVVWAAPAFAMKSAFVRNDKELIRVDLAK